MKHTKTQCGITLILILGCLLITGQRAEAATKWVQKTVSVPYTYYEYETQTRYRLVRKAFTVTEYLYERRAVTTYRYERQRVAVFCCTYRGLDRFKYVWKDVRVPETTYETVRVPYQRTVYKTIREPYLVRVRVERTGYRNEVQWVKVYVPARKFTWNYPRNNYRNTNWKSLGSGFTLQIGVGRNNPRDRKHESIRGRDNRKNRRDNSRTMKSRTTPKRDTKRGASRKTGKTRTGRSSGGRRRR